MLRDKQGKTSLVIDIATPNDSYVNKKETKKLSKYIELEVEFSRMWKVKTNILPVIVGALWAR